MLQARERAPTFFFSIIFILGFTFQFFKEFGGQSANAVYTNEHSSVPKNSDTYKDKWGVVYGDFKHIFD
jgi:hypothetical protein